MSSQQYLRTADKFLWFARNPGSGDSRRGEGEWYVDESFLLQGGEVIACLWGNVRGVEGLHGLLPLLDELLLLGVRGFSEGQQSLTELGFLCG